MTFAEDQAIYRQFDRKAVAGAVCRLLIVDPDPVRAEKTLSLLDWAAYGITSVAVAQSRTEARNQALELNPELALVSARLGDGRGCELVSELRTLGLKTLFCMVSDSLDPAEILEAMRSGARDYLARPLKPGEVRAFLGRTKGLGGAVMPSQSPPDRDPVLGIPYAGLSKITKELILAVRDGYPALLTLTAIAEEMDMSSKYIGRVFLKDTGIKFSEYLMAYRMLEARRLITGTQETISAIAGMVGYVQLNHFYVHFKTYFGVSPGALRGQRTIRGTAAEGARP